MVPFLPEELPTTDEGGGVLELPSHHGVPLVQPEGQISVAAYPLQDTITQSFICLLMCSRILPFMCLLANQKLIRLVLCCVDFTLAGHNTSFDDADCTTTMAVTVTGLLLWHCVASGICNQLPHSAASTARCELNKAADDLHTNLGLRAVTLQ